MKLTLISLLLVCCGHVITSHVIHVNVTDNVERGAVIADVRSSLSNLYDPTVLDQLTFVFISNPDSLFALDDRTGTVTATRPLDRDELCPGRRQCVARVDVGVRPSRYFIKLRLDVAFADVNDNDPTFRTRDVRLEVSEATAPGSALPLPTASDPDGPPFGVDRYELQAPDTDAFELRVSRSDDGGDDESTPSFDLRLVVAKRLDRESTATHRLTVLAVDGGRPERTGSVNVEVLVGDVNDNRPVFEQSVYEVEVSEDWVVTSPRPLVTVRAADADDESTVTYRFTDRTIDDYGQLFDVDRHSGVITLINSIDYERVRSATLEVLAEDDHLHSSPVLARVHVSVRDVNDNTPVVELIPAASVTSDGDVIVWELNVTEHSSNRTFVGHVTVSDADDGGRQRVTCSLYQADNRPSRHFVLVEEFVDAYVIVTTNAPTDREMAAVHHLTLECTDTGFPARTNVTNIVVNVADIDDHILRFTQPVYNCSVRENSQPLEVLVHVTANDDDDSDEHLPITYNLVDADGFAIDHNSGIIWTNQTFDRESTERLEFHVTASNKHDATATATVVVHIEDDNDQAPRFTQRQYIFHVNENRPAGSRVGQVSAVDADMAPNNHHSYYVDGASGDDDRATSLFGVDERTGRVYTRRSLDREHRQTFRVTLVVRDDVVATQRDTTIVVIKVTDDNDEPPIFQFPTRGNDTVLAPADVAVGGRVTRVIAVDRDSGDNALLRYSITAGNEHRLFDIEPATGWITANGSLAQYAMETFILVVSAADAGSRSRSSSATLCVVVSDGLTQSHGSANGEAGGLVGQLLHLPVSAAKVIVIVGLLFALCVIIVSICLIVCVYRRHRARKHPDKPIKGDHHSPSSTTNTSTSSNAVPNGHHVDLVDPAVQHSLLLTPAPSSAGSSSDQGRCSSGATASVFLEEEDWDNVPRLTDSLCRRSLGPGVPANLPPPFSPLRYEAAAACCDDMLTWSMAGHTYEPCCPSTTYSSCTGAAGLQCGPADPACARMMHYGTGSRTMTNRALKPSYRAQPYPADCLSAAGEMVTPAHSQAGADDYLCAVPTSSRSNFANWLNKESLQLQQSGSRYRVNDLPDRRLCPAVTSSSHVMRDVTRMRLQGGDVDPGRNVRFDDVTTTALPPDHFPVYSPAAITCTTDYSAITDINHR